MRVIKSTLDTTFCVRTCVHFSWWGTTITWNWSSFRAISKWLKCPCHRLNISGSISHIGPANSSIHSLHVCCFYSSHTLLFFSHNDRPTLPLSCDRPQAYPFSPHWFILSFPLHTCLDFSHILSSNHNTTSRSLLDMISVICEPVHFTTLDIVPQI